MLSFLRKYSYHIMIVLIFAFVGSIALFGVSSSFSGRSSKASQQKVKQYSDFATLGEQPLDRYKYIQMLSNTFQRLPQEQLDPTFREFMSFRVFQDFVEMNLLVMEAKARKIKVSGAELNEQIKYIMSVYKISSKKKLKELIAQNGMDYNYFKKDITDSILAMKLRQSITDSIKLSDQEFNNYYKEVKARHILIEVQQPEKADDIKAQLAASDDARKRADEILEQAKSGEDFSALASKYSQGPSAKRGGDLGWFGVSMMVKPFEDAAFSLAPGEITGPVKTQFGYHIILVEDVRLKDKPEDKTDEELRKSIEEEKKNKVFAEILGPLKEQYKLEIEDPSLKAYQYKMMGKIEEAIGQYQRLVSSDPVSPIPHIFIGQIYSMQGKKEQAISEYEKGLIKEELNPKLKNPFLHFALAQAYIDSKMNNKAVEQYDFVSDIAGDNLFLRRQLVDKYKSVKAFSKQMKETEEVKRIEIEIAEKKKAAEEAEKLKSATENISN